MPNFKWTPGCPCCDEGCCTEYSRWVYNTSAHDPNITVRNGGGATVVDGLQETLTLHLYTLGNISIVNEQFMTLTWSGANGYWSGSSSSFPQDASHTLNVKLWHGACSVPRNSPGTLFNSYTGLFGKFWGGSMDEADALCFVQRFGTVSGRRVDSSAQKYLVQHPPANGLTGTYPSCSFFANSTMDGNMTSPYTALMSDLPYFLWRLPRYLRATLNVSFNTCVHGPSGASPDGWPECEGPDTIESHTISQSFIIGQPVCAQSWAIGNVVGGDGDGDMGVPDDCHRFGMNVALGTTSDGVNAIFSYASSLSGCPDTCQGGTSSGFGAISDSPLNILGSGTPFTVSTSPSSGTASVEFESWE